MSRSRSSFGASTSILECEPVSSGGRFRVMRLEAQMGDSPPINREYLTTMCGDDSEFEKELLDSYLEASPPVLASLRQGVEAGDAAVVRSAAHTLKGSSRAIGAEPVGAGCETLEEQARAEDLSGAAALLDVIEARYREVDAFIRSHWS